MLSRWGSEIETAGSSCDRFEEQGGGEVEERRLAMKFAERIASGFNYSGACPGSSNLLLRQVAL